MGVTDQGLADSRVEAHLGKVKSLVDLGCGDGSWLDAYSAPDAIGIDIDAARLGVAPGPPARTWTFISADLDAGIPLEDGRVDGVRANQVIEHIRNPLRLVAEVHRVLRPGGAFVATTPNIRYAKHVLRLAVLGEGPMTSHRGERTADDWDDGHIHYFTARDLEWLAERAGFSAYHTEALIDRQGRFRGIREALDRRRRHPIVKGLLSGNLLLVARK